MYMNHMYVDVATLKKIIGVRQVQIIVFLLYFYFKKQWIPIVPLVHVYVM